MPKRKAVRGRKKRGNCNKPKLNMEDTFVERKHDEMSARKSYLRELSELEHSVAEGNIDNFIRLIDNINDISTVETEEDLKYFHNDSSNPLKYTNLIILACKHNQTCLLKYVCSNNNILKMLSIHSGRTVHPGDADEMSHSAFYYAIRSGNVELYEFLAAWAETFIDTYFDELDEIISQPYEELKLKQVPLTEDMEVCVENKLVNMRFFTDNYRQNQCITNDVDNIIKRIELVIEKIELLTTDYSNAEVEELFLYITTFIARNIHVLKRQLKCTYDRLPWEEMEFLLICFVSSYTKEQEINLFYHTAFNKTTVLQYLKHFSKKLIGVKETIGVSIDKLGKIPSINRNTIVANIIRNNPEFEELYKIYRKIRDGHSLHKIGDYVKLASSVDPGERTGQLTVIRVLQLIGEYLKNTLESPKLSDLTSDLLFLTLSKSTRKIITSLRDSFSHISVFKETDRKFFSGVQSDLKKFGDKVIEMVYANKMRNIEIIFSIIIASENIGDLKDNLKNLKYIPIDEIDSPSLKTMECKNLEALITELSGVIPDKTSFEQKCFSQITCKIHFANAKLQTFQKNYINEFFFLKDLLFKLYEFDDSHLHIIGILKSRAELALKNILLNTTIPSHTFLEIGELARKIYFSVTNRKCNEDLDEVMKLFYEISFITLFQTGNTKWIEDLRSKLNDEDSSTSKKKKRKVYETQEMNNYLELKLSELKSVLRNNTSNKTAEKIPCFKEDKKFQAAVEMLVLDIMSALDESRSLLNNPLFLDENYPLLIGRCLRNHLAHDNMLFDILLSRPTTTVVLNAVKLIEEDIIKNTKKIGKIMADNPLAARGKYERCFEILIRQRKMYIALEEGNLENIKECLKNGADITSRDINLRTALHYAVKGPSLDVVKFVLEQNVEVNVKDRDGRNPLHVAAAFGNTNTAEYLIENVGLPIDALDNGRKSPLHIAAQKGHTNIVEILLKHKADTSALDINGLLALNHAIRNNNLCIVKLLLEEDFNVDAYKVMGGFTLLHYAAEFGHLQIIIFLLQNGANVNAKNDRNWTPLHAAALNGHLDVVNALISYGADVNARVIDGCTPLHYALEYGNDEIATILLNHGARVNVSDKVFKNTPLNYAVRSALQNIVTTLIKYGADATVSNIEGTSPLHVAAEMGNEGIVTLLLKQGVDIHAKDVANATPLYYAVRSGHINVAEVLIKYGAIIDTEDINGFTPLYIAVLEGRKDIVNFLVERKANTNFKDTKGDAILHVAAVKNYKEIVDILIKNKADINIKNNDGGTPLHSAAIAGCEDVVISLLEYKAEVNPTNSTGMTPLHFAAINGHENIVKILIEHKANIHAYSDLGTPLNIAIVDGHKITTQLLIANGADVNASSSNHVTPLYTAVKYNQKEIVDVLVKNKAIIDDKVGSLSLAVYAGYRDIVEVLIKHKTEFDVVDSENKTLLHIAAGKGHLELVKTLIKRGMDVNAKTKDSRTPLYFAAYSGHEEVVEILIENGANLHIAAQDSSYPLHYAARNGHIDVIQILLDNEANINVKDIENRSPLELAVAKGHLKVVKLILQYSKTYINAKGNDNYTLLHIAAQGNNLEIVKYLVDVGADINSKNAYGSKPIHIAAREGFKDAVEYLLIKGSSIDVLGAFNQTLLHYAALENRLEIAEYLIARGADVNAKDTSGNRPIHIAAVKDFLEIIEILLKNGAAYNPSNHLNEKPLDMVYKKDLSDYLMSIKHYFEAVKNNNLTQVKIYIKGTRIVVDVKDAYGASPLHFAAWKGHEEILNILLENNANPNTVDNKRNTPLHYAVKFSHLQVVKTLLRYGAIFNAVANNGKTPTDFSTDKNIVSLLKLVNDSFESIRNNNTKIIDDLNKIKDIDTVRAIMSACNAEKETLVVLAIRCNFPNVEELKNILQNGTSDSVMVALELAALGDYETALFIFNQVYERRKHILGSNNPGTLEIERHIAIISYKQCNYKEALGKLKEIYQKQKQMLGLRNKETLNTRSLFALVLYKQGKNEEALQIFQEVYQMQKEVIGPNHPDSLNTLLHTALVLGDQGKHEEALNINRTVYDEHKRKFGANHHKTVIAQTNIATNLSNQGNLDEALEIYRDVFEKKKFILGVYHADTLKTQRSIATILGSQKKYDEAVEANKEILKIQENVLGPDHPETLMTYYILGNIFFEEKKYAKAYINYTKCFEKLKSVFGSTNLIVTEISIKIETIKYIYRIDGGGTSEFILHMQDDMKTAIMNGDRLTVLRLLKEGTDVNEKDNDGVTLLHYAVNYEHVEIVRILLKKGANALQVTSKGNTPLHTAVLKDNINISKVLLQHVQQDKLSGFINARTTSGNTAVLHVAAENGSLEIVKMLLRYGAIYDIKNNRGKKPQDISSNQMVTHLLKLVEDLFDDAEKGNGDIIEKLKSIQFGEFLAVTEARNNQCNTLLQVLITNQYNEIAHKLTEMIKNNI